MATLLNLISLLRWRSLSNCRIALQTALIEKLTLSHRFLRVATIPARTILPHKVSSSGHARTNAFVGSGLGPQRRHARQSSGCSLMLLANVFSLAEIAQQKL